jgi:hypothetical protein
VIRAGVFSALILLAHTSSAESFFVKYRGEVDLAPFRSDTITRSSFIDRLCDDSKESYVLVSLNGTFYHYCEQGVVNQWLAADSMGRYYNAFIKGQYDCRTHHVPSY